jgi:hypothetical protein
MLISTAVGVYRGIPIPRGGRNVVTNTVLPRFFVQKVVTKVVTFLVGGRNKHTEESCFSAHSIENSE